MSDEDHPVEIVRGIPGLDDPLPFLQKRGAQKLRGENDGVAAGIRKTVDLIFPEDLRIAAQRVDHLQPRAGVGHETVHQHDGDPAGIEGFETVEALHLPGLLGTDHVEEEIERRRILGHVGQRRGEILLQRYPAAAQFDVVCVAGVRENQPGTAAGIPAGGKFVERHDESSRQNDVFREVFLSLPFLFVENDDQRHADAEPVGFMGEIDRPVIRTQQKGAFPPHVSGEPVRGGIKKHRLSGGGGEFEAAVVFEFPRREAGEQFRQGQIVHADHPQTRRVVNRSGIVQFRDVTGGVKHRAQIVADRGIRIGSETHAQIEGAVGQRLHIDALRFGFIKFLKFFQQPRRLLAVKVVEQKVAQHVHAGGHKTVAPLHHAAAVLEALLGSDPFHPHFTGGAPGRQQDQAGQNRKQKTPERHRRPSGRRKSLSHAAPPRCGGKVLQLR